MSDSFSEKAVFVTISVVGGTTDRITSHWTSCEYDGETFVSMGSMEVQPAKITAGATSKECVISNLLPTTDILIGLRNHLSYPSIEVEVFYADIDPSTNVATDPVFIYKGVVYQASPKIFSSYMSLEIREPKYYSDRVAGISCTEQCFAPFFGDPIICKKAISSRTYTISEVSGNYVTVEDTVSESDSVFNQGFLELNGVVISIKYWKSGQVFQTSSPVSSSWVGRQVGFFYGCDQSKNSCINIHNNESRFLGTGLGMMDYDPKYSTA